MTASPSREYASPMDGSGRSAATENAWRIDAARAASWRVWGGELVVYDDLSGDTLKLDVVATAAFQTLLAGPASATAVTKRLAALLDLEADPRLHRVAEIALGRLAATGVVVQLPAACDLETPTAHHG